MTTTMPDNLCCEIPVEPTLQEQIDALVANSDLMLAVTRQNLITDEANGEIRKALLRALPTTLPMAPKKVTVRSVGAPVEDLRLSFEVTARREVVALLAVLPGVDVLMVGSGCTSFVPEQRYVASGKAGETVTEIASVVYRVSTWLGKVREEYTWWTSLAGHLVQVVATTPEGGRTEVSVRSDTRNGPHDDVRTTWSYLNLPQGEITRWYGGSPKVSVPLSIHQRRGVAFKDAIAALNNYETSILTPRCDC